MLSVLVVFKEKGKTSGITVGEAFRDFSAPNLKAVGFEIVQLRNGLPISPGSRWETHQIIVLDDESGIRKQDSGIV